MVLDSWEQRTKVKIVAAFVIVFLAVLGAVLSIWIFHEENPFRVVSPKGALMIAENLTAGDIQYVNAVFIKGDSPQLTFMGDDITPADVEIRLLTPGWCMDLWKWGGAQKGWELAVRCSDNLTLSYYSFSHRPARESGLTYWRLEDGYLLVFHKREPVEDYEEVHFKVEYNGHSDEGYFRVSLGKR